MGERQRPPYQAWTQEDIDKLAALDASGAKQKVLFASFPNRSRGSVQGQRHRMRKKNAKGISDRDVV